MAGSYTLPQVRVFQEFSETPNDVTQNLNPFVIGPNYQLFRYSDEDEREECRTGAYDGSKSLLLKWKGGYTGSTVDTDWDGVAVTFEDAYVRLGDHALAAASCLDATSGSGTKFEFALSGKSLADETDPTKLEFGIPVKAGDYLVYTDSSNVEHKTKIRSISCGTLDPSKEPKEISATLKNKSTGVQADVFTWDVSKYNGERDVSIILTVTRSGDAFKMTWKSNFDISGAVDTIGDDAISLGRGVTVTKTTSLAIGTYVLAVTLHEPYARDTVTVTDLVPVSPLPTFTFLRLVDAEEISSTFISADDTGVTVDPDVQIDLGSGTLRSVYTATAYLTQRNLVNSHTDGVYSISTQADIIRELGAIAPENPLAYALRIMLLNCATATIKYIAVKSDDQEGYSTALDRASLASDVYAFCPLTEDASIIEDVVAHCNTMSSEDNKNWRIAFFSKPTANSTDITPTVYDVPEQCRVSDKILTCYNTGTETQSQVSDFTNTVSVGDTVTVLTTTLQEVTTTVVDVKNSTQLELKDSISDASSKNCDFTITHVMEPAEYVAAIAATSSHFRDRRAYNVFPNTLRDSSGNYVSGIYGAAAVCALACSVAPQQPITNVEISGFSDLKDVYSTFNRDELNTIAAGGTLILMQERSGDTVYVRHQISTAYPDGNLNTTELSMTKNLDSISYYFANRFAPYIGRYNITEDLLTELKGVLKDGLAHLESATETNKLIGPQLIADGTEINSLYQDTSEKDKVYANVSLNLPAPFNNFDLHLQVI